MNVIPIYNFKCDNCGHTLEEYQKLNDKPLKKCPACKKHKLIKIISLPAKPFVSGHPIDEYQKVKQEAKQIAQKIIKGDEKAIADVYGESAVSDKTKELSKPKKLQDVKNKGVIRRKD